MKCEAYFSLLWVKGRILVYRCNDKKVFSSGSGTHHSKLNIKSPNYNHKVFCAKMTSVNEKLIENITFCD